MEAITLCLLTGEMDKQIMVHPNTGIDLTIKKNKILKHTIKRIKRKSIVLSEKRRT